MKDTTLRAFAICIERIGGSLIDILINLIGIVVVALIIILAIEKKRCKDKRRLIKRFLLMADLYQWGIDSCPLLGTLGTVVALIVTTGSSGGEALKADFMYALTSTFWGLVWAVLCKLLESALGVNGYYEALAEEFETKDNA